MSLYKAKQCILQVSGIHWAGGEIQVRRGGIYQWRKVEQGGGWIDKENAVLRELYRSLVTKRKLSNIAKLSVFKSAFVRILTYDPESWVMTEMKSQEQAAEMGFLRRSQWCDTSRQSAQLWNSQSPESGTILLWIERAQIYWFGSVSIMPHERLARQIQLDRFVWNSCWPWGIPSPPRAAAPAALEKRARKWMNWITFRLFRLFTGV